MGSFVNWNHDDSQWVGDVDAGSGSSEIHYLFGRVDQTTAGLTTRADIAFTPTVSLQLYAEPFVSAGAYRDLKRVSDPGARRYTDRFEALEPRVSGGTYYADLDGDGSEESWSDPDFKVRQFRSNAVLRWEYRPGSALFLVWSQGRDERADKGTSNFGSDVRELFRVRPENVFMVKLSYWMSP